MDVSINAHAYLFLLRHWFHLQLRSIKHEVTYFESNDVNVKVRPHYLRHVDQHVA